MTPLLEVCVESLEAARRAQAGGAGRIELCAELSIGGLTSSEQSMHAVRACCGLPIVAMVRPRGGNFSYGMAELEAMKRSIDVARDAGMNGVVLGVLDRSGHVDRPAIELLVAHARGLTVTFHRAFDETPDPLAALEQLVQLGVSRILTSGQAPSALRGAQLLARWVERARDRITVMPGGGVRAENAVELRRTTGALEFHSSVGFPGPLTVESVERLVAALEATNRR